MASGREAALFQHLLRFLHVVDGYGELHEVLDLAGQIDRIDVDRRSGELVRHPGELAGLVLEEDRDHLLFRELSARLLEPRARRLHVVTDEVEDHLPAARARAHGFEAHPFSRKALGDAGELAGAVPDGDAELLHGGLLSGWVPDLDAGTESCLI